MTLLLSAARLAERRAIARGPLAPLADSLMSDLAPLLMDGFDIPREKAMMSRAGGRCADDGTLLEFDPFDPRHHRCRRCARAYEGEEHYRWWIMSYQLWLAERAVHAAVLRLLRGDESCGALARAILEQYVDAYTRYPNRDNVLGPTRLFFSTYLESIWLLQICVALDLLEAAGLRDGLGARVRERIVEPSSALIRSYDEGASNRQVWNNAALLASTAVLGSLPSAEELVWGSSGLVSHLARGLLVDGTWYEGENYHLFAHRGLWYGVHLAERLDLGLGESFVAPFVTRFEAGFSASFASALPDLTLPSRRDSQYAISVRQWRFAELCELGLVRTDDAALHGMLTRLYAADVPRGDVGRARSTAEVERNLPPTRLTRSDLGWRCLLLARAEHPTNVTQPPASVLLEGQGLAVLRRERGSVYAALDYGHSGGGHGHPDRLNLLLAHDSVRWLDDMGTGSYVDPTLHWYRSTLAHNAPFVNGRSQERVSGELLAFDDDGAHGWMDASVAGIAPGVAARRTVVVAPGYLLDRLTWTGPSGTTVDLPLHLDADAPGEESWAPSALGGGTGLEDGFGHLTGAECVEHAAGEVLALRARRDEAHRLAAWTTIDADHECWRAMAPGPPGHGAARFYLFRTHAPAATVRTLIDWSGSVRTVDFAGDETLVHLVDGAVHRHRPTADGWQITHEHEEVRRQVALRGSQARPVPTPVESAPATSPEPAVHRIPPVADARRDRSFRPLRFPLAEESYRRSELAWQDAGRPRAVVSLSASEATLHLDVAVEKDDPVAFVPRREHNPLDNEHPDINSDGLQIHLALPGAMQGVLTWLLVPEPGGDTVRVTPPEGGPPVAASCALTGGGYVIRVSMLLPREAARNGFLLDVIINDISPDRQRRRGQLVMSGGAGWVYLRGDRQPLDRMMRFVIEAND